MLLPSHSQYNMSLVPGDTTPIYMTTHRHSSLNHNRIDVVVTNMLNKDIIIPSTNDWISNRHLIKKDDGTFRFYISFKPLNKVTIHDTYPLPRVYNLLDQLSGSYYFISLNLAWGYWKIPLKLSDTHKTSFGTCHGLFQFTHMPFGLSYASNTFQRMAKSIFAALISKGILLVYLYDIFIHTTAWEDHLQTLVDILARITKHNFQLQWTSSSLAIESVRMLQR